MISLHRQFDIVGIALAALLFEGMLTWMSSRKTV